MTLNGFNGQSLLVRIALGNRKADRDTNGNQSTDPHHMRGNSLQRAVKGAVPAAPVAKRVGVHSFQQTYWTIIVRSPLDE
jgi:hypothetical protein